MRHPHSAPASGDGEEYVGGFGDKQLLLLRREHQVAIALLRVGEGREDFAADAEIDGAHVRAFLYTFQAQGDFAEIGGSHERQSIARV